MRCHVRGLAAHGSFPERGDNAIEKAARLIVAVHDENFTRVEHALLGRDVPGALWIEGGGELHAIRGSRQRPDRRSRVVPGGPTAAEIETRVRELADLHDAEVDPVEPSVEPFETPATSPVLAVLEAAAGAVGASGERVGVPAWTDAHNFVELAGSEAVVWGPGDFGLAHDPAEAVDLHEVVAAARVVERLLLDAPGWLS